MRQFIYKNNIHKNNQKGIIIMKKTFYICVISQFNVAEFEACLTIQPDHILLVVSKEEPYIDKAQLFKEALGKQLPQTQFVDLNPKHYALDGGSLDSVREWCEAVFSSSLIEQFKAYDWIINATGGTKAIIIVLMQFIEQLKLSEQIKGNLFLNYKDFKKPQLQIQQMNDEQWQSLEDKKIKSATAQEILSLYSDQLTFGKKDEIRDKLQFAQFIWTSLHENKETISALFEAIAKAWEENGNLEQSLVITPKIEALINELNEFGKDLFKLETPFKIIDAQTISIPARKKSKIKAYSRFIEGEWLEAELYSWLAKELEDNQIEWSVKENNSKNQQNKEIDFFVHHQSTSFFIEVKADLPNNKLSNWNEIRKQISERGTRLGQGTNILFIGPELQEKLEQHLEKDLIEETFDMMKIKIIHSKEKLLEALKIK